MRRLIFSFEEYGKYVRLSDEDELCKQNSRRKMTQQLKQVFEMVSGLDPDFQNELAASWLADLDWLPRKIQPTT